MSGSMIVASVVAGTFFILSTIMLHWIESWAASEVQATSPRSAGPGRVQTRSTHAEGASIVRCPCNRAGVDGID